MKPTSRESCGMGNGMTSRGAINHKNTIPLLNPVNPSPCPQAWLTTTVGSSRLPLWATFSCPPHSVTCYSHLPAGRRERRRRGWGSSNRGTEAIDDEARDCLAATRQRSPSRSPSMGVLPWARRGGSPAEEWRADGRAVGRRSLASRCSRMRLRFRLGGTITAQTQ